MQLQQLRYFVEVAESKSMNKAAKRLFISQPNLSNAIMSLEEAFKIQLFDRNNRGNAFSIKKLKAFIFVRKIKN